LPLNSKALYQVSHMRHNHKLVKKSTYKCGGWSEARRYEVNIIAQEANLTSNEACFIECFFCVEERAVQVSLAYQNSKVSAATTFESHYKSLYMNGSTTITIVTNRME